MGIIDSIKTSWKGLMNKLRKGDKPLAATNATTSRHYPRYLHVSKPITEQMRKWAGVFHPAFVLSWSRGTQHRSPVRQEIKALEREPNGIVSQLNNKQRRRWRSRCRKFAKQLEAQA